MSDKTGISWTDATWNPIRGCSRVSEGCRNCYAEQQAARIVRMGKGKPTAYDGLVEMRGRQPLAPVARWTGVVRLVTEHLADPLRWKRPRRIFVNSMSDLFHESLTNEQIAAVFGVMAAARQHTFQVLTKRSKRMRQWFAWINEQSTPLITIPKAPRLTCRVFAERVLEEAGSKITNLGTESQPRQWPLPNVWLGVSTEDQETYVERTRDLHFVPAARHFISAEPLLGAIDMRADNINPGWLDWVIAGCESGHGARPCDVDWLRTLRDQCAASGVAFFLKQAQETDMGTCGDADNPNGDEPCGERVRYHVYGPKDSSASCGCTAEGAEDANGCPPLGFGDGSKRKPDGVIELPYLDGVQHAAFPQGAPNA